MSLQRCPRAHCGGSILWGCCLLCGRDPKNPATVGTHHQHREHHQDLQVHHHQQSQERGDPYLSLARKVLDYPEAEAPDF